MVKEFVLEIFRYDPEVDRQPSYREYFLELTKGMTFAQALTEIKQKQDRTLTFRKGCGSGICGTCAVKINGNSFLLCKTKVKELLTTYKTIRLKIDPLNKRAVIKDLVIDEDYFWKDIKKISPWIRSNNDISADLSKIEKSSDCIFCMCCTADCQVNQHDISFVGPAAFVKLHKFVFDPRDSSKRIKKAVDQGLWKCAHMYNCMDQCPMNIDPAEKISDLRELSIKKRVSHPGQKHAKEFLDSLKQYGNLDEKRLVRKTVGLKGIKLLGKSLKMALKGKFKDINPRQIKDKGEFRKIIQEVENE